MKLQILSAHLRNFKGHKKLDIQFGEKETNIYGQNAAGKTSVFDAVLYNLFGKDSQDNKTFPIQTLDKDGNRIDRLETEVTCVYKADHRTVELKRVYKQKWTKKRGAEKEEYVGNEEDLFINDVPCKLSEYKAKVDSLIEEQIFKAITNSNYFVGLNWKTRRSYLLDMFGKVSDLEIAGNNKDMVKLIEMLASQQKSFDEYKSEVSAKKRKIKEELQTISPRIDEADQAKPLPEDWAKLEADIKAKSAQIEEIENIIGSQIDSQKLMNKKILEHDNKIFEAQRELQKIESGIKAEYDKPDDSEEKLKAEKRALTDLEVVLSEVKRTINRYESNVFSFGEEITELEGKKATVLEEWKKINAEKFEVDPNKCECPTCKRAFDADDLEAKKEQWEADFNKDKKERLDSANARGRAFKNMITELEERIENGEKAIEGKQLEVEGLKVKIEDQKKLIESLQTGKVEKESYEMIRDCNKEYKAQLKVIEDLKAATPKKDESFDLVRKEKQAEKAAIQSEIDQLRNRLNNRDLIKKQEERIAQLEEQETNLSQELANFERQEFLMLEFSKKKMESIEDAINSKFKVARFKMFRKLINGGEEECCDITVDGVPFESVNHAGKVNAALDIINALSDHYEYKAPIFLDGRESVSEIIDTDAQIVNLFVSPNDKSLRVA